MIKAIVFDCFGVLVTNDFVQKPDRELFAYIQHELAPKYTIAMLSNASAGGPQRYIPAELLRVFDGRIYVSGEIGHEKPNRAAFEYVARKLGIDFSEMLFIDDLTRFTEPAQEYGIRSVLYEDLPGLQEELTRILSA